MLIAVVQSLLAAIACGLLFVAFRRFQAPVSWFVAAGLFIRAVAGQVIFWISWLELPFARGMTMGRGFWFYARDAVKYFDAVGRETTQKGVAAAVFSLDMYGVSPGFRKLLTLTNALFGHVPSAALLLNLAAFLGTCAIVVALAGERKRVAAIAVAGISFSPAMILWSTQILKDTLFAFLFVAFIGTVAWWISAWRGEQKVLPRAIAATVAMLLVLSAIASVRWYYAVVLLGVALPILIIVALRSRRSLRALALLVVVFGLVFAGTLMFARVSFAPAMLEKFEAVRPTDVAGMIEIVAGLADGARVAFDQLPASTAMSVGPALPMRMSPRARRFISGTAALLLPRPIARATGLVEMSGGRGLWFFADLDTVFFDIFLIIALVALLRAPRLAKWRNPLLWLVLIVTVLTAVAFVYTVSNFGALFRYRSMMFLGIVLIPVVATWPAKIKPWPET